MMILQNKIILKKLFIIMYFFLFYFFILNKKNKFLEKRYSFYKIFEDVMEMVSLFYENI